MCWKNPGIFSDFDSILLNKKGGSDMSVNFSESKTKENLMRAFAGESQARNRYTIAAERAED